MVEKNRALLYTIQDGTPLMWYDPNPWRLMQVHGAFEQSNGIYGKDQITFVGMARQLPAIFESGSLCLINDPEAISVFTQAAQSAQLKPLELMRVLNGGFVVIYSFEGNGE